MQRIPVSSSNVRDVGYDASSQVLEVGFHSGGVYQYLSVPPERYSGMMNAASKGTYLNDYIKPYYRFLKIR